jgi:hypothetical protein
LKVPYPVTCIEEAIFFYWKQGSGRSYMHTVNLRICTLPFSLVKYGRYIYHVLHTHQLSNTHL